MRIQPEYMCLKIVARVVVAMSSRHTSSVPKEDVVFPRMLYCDSRCSQTLTGLSLAHPGALLCNAVCRLGDRQHVILRQRVRGSVRAVRAVRNTRVFPMEPRVVADVVDCSAPCVHTMCRVVYRHPMPVSLPLGVLSVSYFKRSHWQCSQL
jgi:hypothetical protein